VSEASPALEFFLEETGEVPAGLLVEEKMQVIAANVDEPRVTVLPPTKRLPAAGFSASDRVVLALEPQLLDRRTIGSDPQEACDPYLFAIASTIRCGFRVGRPPPPAYLETVGAAIAEHLRAHYPVGRRRRERHGLSETRLARALAVIERHLDTPLAVNEIAAVVHLSAFHFARMFRRSMACSPHEYITRRRLEKAKQLLAGSDLSMRAIAHTVGYRTQAHFTRVFHEGTGTTPRRYRVQRRAMDDAS